jgi:hypothetical protein
MSASIPGARRRAVLALLMAAVTVLAATGTAATAHAATTVIPVSGTSGGRVFDGIGAISGGGGNSRLLIEYPEPYRSRVLDYLFKPGYGAALQILKVEIGGDTNSTDGAESSHEHTRGDRNCDRGYEWWLMEQAKARNPDIKLYGLAWGAPGWPGGGNFWSSDTVGYLMDWLGCARSHHLRIDYLGGWNEKGFDKAFYENLHATLRRGGYDTRVVGADSGWDVADAMLADPAFAASVDVIGAHYPCTYMSAMTSCASTPNAVATGKRLWASENGSEDFQSGGAPIARAINRGYLDAKMTSYINWPLVAATYPNLPYPTMGLMVANQPWSGSYSVGSSVWATAHTTQFTRPGWRYVDSASGYFGGDRAAGSYVTLRAPDNSAYSVVAETLDATAPRTVAFRVSGGLPAHAVHVWASDFRTGDYLRHVEDVPVRDGVYSVTLRPGSVYSITTTTGQGRGSAASPPQASLALPWTDDFDGYQPGREPRLLAQQQGAFETAPCGGGRRGGCVRQMAPLAPINWDAPASPYALLGDRSWADYTVTADAYFEQRSAVQLLGRIGAQRGFSVSGYNGYSLEVSSAGGWRLLRNDLNANLTVLATGSVPPPGTGTWHRLSVSFQGATITAAVDGVRVGAATDATYRTGQAGIGTDGYATDEFDNLAVTPIGRQPIVAGYQLVNVHTGQSLAVDAAGRAVQAAVTGAPDQVWQAAGDGSGWLSLVNAASGRVLDASPGTPVRQLRQADRCGRPDQQWQLRPGRDGSYTVVNRRSGLAVTASHRTTVALRRPDGRDDQSWRLVSLPVVGGTYTVVNRNSGLVLDVYGESTADGGQIVQWPYHGGANQQWRLVGTSDGTYALVNVGSGKLLEEPDGTQGGQLDQRGTDGQPGQQWRLVDAGDGYWRLANHANGLLADVAGQSTAPGAAVVQWPDNGGLNQQWRLEPATVGATSGPGECRPASTAGPGSVLACG